ncbi:MAG: hypothetical protein JWQ18_228 [Conexibacter sp.]|nr:hypothetical protein [Conexibacter sp.]
MLDLRWAGLLAAAAIVAMGSQPLAAHAATRCAGSKGSVTVVANAQVRVYFGRAAPGYHACSKVTGKLTKLGPPQADLTVVDLSRWRLRGSLLAYVREKAFYKESPTFVVVVRDARTGHTLRALDAAPPDGSGSAVGYDQQLDLGVRDLALTADGRVAWIVTNPYAKGFVMGDAATQVWKADRAGVTLLDPGPDDIAPGSLELTGDALQWIRGGQPQSATLS